MANISRREHVLNGMSLRQRGAGRQKPRRVSESSKGRHIITLAVAHTGSKVTVLWVEIRKCDGLNPTVHYDGFDLIVSGVEEQLCSIQCATPTVAGYF